MKLNRRSAAARDGRMPLMDHIRELRNRLIKAIIALVIGAIIGWILFEPAWGFLKQPYTQIPPEHCLEGKCDLVVHGIFDGFFLRLKIALIIGAVLVVAGLAVPDLGVRGAGAVPAGSAARRTRSWRPRCRCSSSARCWRT